MKQIKQIKTMLYKLTKKQFEDLTEDQQKEYTLDGDNATLKIEGDDAPTQEAIERLESKRNIEADHRKKAEDRLKAAEDRAQKLQDDLENAGGNKGELEKLKADHSAQLEAMRKEREEETAKVKADRDASMIREEADKIANTHFTIPGLISPQISSRLTVEEVDGSPVVRVLAPDGKPSTASIADLTKDFIDNKEFSTIIKAKVGTGGGATGNTGGGATGKSLSEMTATEEAIFAKEKPEEYAAATNSLTA